MNWTARGLALLRHVAFHLQRRPLFPVSDALDSDCAVTDAATARGAASSRSWCANRVECCRRAGTVFSYLPVQARTLTERSAAGAARAVATGSSGRAARRGKRVLIVYVETPATPGRLPCPGSSGQPRKVLRGWG